MASLKVQPAFEEAVHQLGEDQIELHDHSGQLMGYYLSAETHRKMLYAYANSLVTDEELTESRKSKERVSTQALIQRLNAIG